MKSADSRKYLFSTLVDKAGEVERVADTKPAFDTAKWLFKIYRALRPVAVE